MLKDYEIAQQKKLLKITTVANKIGLTESNLELYGNYKAKININREINKNNKLVLVTAINPTPFGEGKTTVAIGLNDALNKLGIKSLLTLREPSMGPVFGIKGGATGGGYAQVVPMEDINLHFTGDFHAITSANNLICAMIDNTLKHGNYLNLDINKISFNRTVDMNDRALREVEIALGGSVNGIPRKDHFTITSASEVMAVLCLAQNEDDLRRRLEKIIVGKNIFDDYVYVKDLGIVGSLMAILKDAIKPNLVQSLEENPVIIHGGPFANIAHGCNSVIATNLARGLSDYTITEAGFGSDLGALKFLDIVCRKNNIEPSVVVLVTTIRALKYNGGVKKEFINEENLECLTKGLPNLEVHIENLKMLGVNILVTLNKYDTDTDNEVKILKKFVDNMGYKLIINTVFSDGGDGAIELASEVLKIKENKIKFLYKDSSSIENKIDIICKKLYRAKIVNYSEKALSKLKDLNQRFGNYPICIAKTQYSISDNKNLLGKPEGHTMLVRDLKVNNGAEFITVYMGNIMTMPGLSEKPAALNIDLDDEKRIINIF